MTEATPTGQAPARRGAAVLTAIVGAFGTAQTAIWTSEIPILQKIGLTVASLAAAGITAYVRERNAAAARTLQRQAYERGLAERATARAALLMAAAEESADCLTDLRKHQRLLGDGLEGADKAREEAVKSVLHALCRVFGRDPSATPEGALEPPALRATFFVFDRNIGTIGGLRRAYWHYPHSSWPRTPTFDFAQWPNAGAARCFLERRPIAIPDILAEAQHGESWQDTRAGQRNQYGHSAMLCLGVWGDEVEGVVTVITTTTNYFSEGQLTFLERLVSPFLEAIRLAYQATPGASPPAGPPIAE